MRIESLLIFSLCIPLFICTPSLDPPKDLGADLEPILKRHNLPAAAAAVILEGKIVALGVAGARKLGCPVKAEQHDAFHLGSCTKAMTATLIAMLVEEGKLKWETTLEEAFPGLSQDVHPDFKGVTLAMLLDHCAGFPPAGRTWPEGKSFLFVHLLPGTPREQRMAYVRMMLKQAPEAAPGEKYIYSNAGYAVAGAAAEEATDTSFEELMEEKLFRPLDMKTAGFGAMGALRGLDQPWQHKVEKDKAIPVAPGPMSDNPPAIAPAGTVHCSVEDWAKFILLHLTGKADDRTLLKPETLERLHAPDLIEDYVAGWGVVERKWAGGRTLTHSGSNTMNFAVVWMAPEKDFAVLAATNQGGDVAAEACDEISWKMIQKYLLRKDE